MCTYLQVITKLQLMSNTHSLSTIPSLHHKTKTKTKNGPAKLCYKGVSPSQHCFYIEVDLYKPKSVKHCALSSAVHATSVFTWININLCCAWWYVVSATSSFTHTCINLWHALSCNASATWSRCRLTCINTNLCHAQWWHCQCYI